MPDEPNLAPQAAAERERERQAGNNTQEPDAPVARISKAEQARVKDAQAANLRIAGFDYATIAKRLGYANHSGAYKAVQRARAAAIREAGAELVTLELDRFDTLQRAAMTKAVQGDTKSIHAVLRVMEQRAKLLRLGDQADQAAIADTRSALAVFLGQIQAQHPDPNPEAA